MFDVFVVGNLVLDQLLWPVDTVRWDGTVWVEKLVRSLGGNGANTSYALAKLGARVGLAGAVGADEEGRELLRILAEVGVDTSAVATLEHPTPATVALVKSNGARAFLHRPGASRHSLNEAVALPPARHLHVANPFGVPALRQLAPKNLANARAAGMSTSLDAGWDSRGEWGKVVLPCAPYLDVLFLNAEEGRLITGEAKEAKVLAALHSAGARKIVLKRGKRGALLSSHEVGGQGYVARVPGYSVAAVDTTGAGDVFAGAFLAAWLRGQSASEAVRFANAAAALSVMALGSVAGMRDFAGTLQWVREQATV
ncbi:MAG: sugar kinase [Bryobacter sp.]